MRHTSVLILILGLWGAFGAGCTQSLENIVDERHQARLDAANAQHPLIHGAADGLGANLSETTPPLTLAPTMPIKASQH